MKKYEKKLTDNKADKILIPMLIRSMRETGFVPKVSINKIIDDCIHSRKSHPNEPLYTNASFWPNDLHFYANSFSALFVARIINMESINSKDINSTMARNLLIYLGSFIPTSDMVAQEVLSAIDKIKSLVWNNITVNERFSFESVIGHLDRKYKFKLKKNFINPYQYVADS